MSFQQHSKYSHLSLIIWQFYCLHHRSNEQMDDEQRQCVLFYLVLLLVVVFLLLLLLLLLFQALCCGGGGIACDFIRLPTIHNGYQTIMSNKNGYQTISIVPIITQTKG